MTPAERLGHELIRRAQSNEPLKASEGSALIKEAVDELERQAKLKAWQRLANDIQFLVKCNSLGSAKQLASLSKLLEGFEA